MPPLFDLFRKNRLFFLGYGLMLLVVGILQLVYTQEQLMQWVNIRNTPAADLLFPYITYLGDGVFFVLVCLIALVYNRGIGWMALASFALSSLASLFLKTIVFPNSPRPLLYFEHSTYQYHIIKGLEIHSYNSFPSGHTTTAFALFSLCAFLGEQKRRGIFLLLLAFLIGYSRVYLFQHFVEDAYVGSLVGTISSIIVYIALYKWALKKTPTGDN